MQSNPKYSILLPAFKGRFLKECLQSVLCQNYKDFELVIVDDASPEDLASIVREFDDPRIRYYRNEVGCGAEHLVDNWNICLGYARGEFVLNMGDDDLLEPDCLLLFDRLIASYPDKDVYHIRTSFIDDEGVPFRLLEERPAEENVYEMIVARWKGRHQMIGDYLYRREPLLTAGGYFDLPYAWGSDDITAFRAAQMNGIANSNTPGFRFRRSRYSISGSVTNIEGKLRATEQSRAWYHMLLSVPSPSKEEERERLSACALEKRHFRKLRTYFLSCDQSHPLGWWYANRTGLGLTVWDLIIAWVKKRIHNR